MNAVTCVVLDDEGNVVNTIVADPAVDTLPGFSIRSRADWLREQTEAEAWA